MNNVKKLDEFITFNSQKTLGGSSIAVWLSCSVIGFILEKCDPYSDWLKIVALVMSVLISFTITVSRKKKMIKYYLLALLNGFLIFSTATGYNTIQNHYSRSGSCHDTAGISDISTISGNVLQNSIISFMTKPWFLPKTLVEDNERLVKGSNDLLAERDSLMNINENLQEELQCIPENEIEAKQRIDSLYLLIEKLEGDLKEERGKLGVERKDEKTVHEIEILRNQLLECNNKLKECLGAEWSFPEGEKVMHELKKLRSENEKLNIQLKECRDKLKKEGKRENAPPEHKKKDVPPERKSEEEN